MMRTGVTLSFVQSITTIASASKPCAEVVARRGISSTFSMTDSVTRGCLCFLTRSAPPIVLFRADEPLGNVDHHEAGGNPRSAEPCTAS